MSALHPIATAKADLRKTPPPMVDMCGAPAYVCFGHCDNNTKKLDYFGQHGFIAAARIPSLDGTREIAETRRCSRDCFRAWSAAAASVCKALKSIATAAVSCGTSADVDGRGIDTNKAPQKVTMAAAARIRTDTVKLPLLDPSPNAALYSVGIEDARNRAPRLDATC
jgi:hypothetical protein